MRSRSLSAVALVSILALTAPAAAMAGGETAKTKVKITEGGPDHFEGKVTSKEDRCLKGRKVSLEYTFGAQYTIDTVKTDADGRWAIDGMFQAGTYRATVAERERGDLLCLAGKGLRAQFRITLARDESGETSVGGTRMTPTSEGLGHYSGKIKGDRKCREGRTVRVIHLSAPPFEIGRTRTDEDGFWELEGPIPPGDSERVKVVVKGTHKCEGAKRTFTVGELR